MTPHQFGQSQRSALASLPEFLATGAAASPRRERWIRVIVADIEGCLNLNEHTYDYEALDVIRRANQLAFDLIQRPSCIPLITIASGRQAPFVEAFSAFIASPLPAVFEGGAGLFDRLSPVGHRHEFVTVDQSLLAAARETVAEVARTSAATASIGKVLLMTLHPGPAMSSRELADLVHDALDSAGLAFEVTFSRSAVDIAPPGVSKGEALPWLLCSLPVAVGAVSLEETLTIGDSDGDLSMLRRTGFSAAPANASPEVQRVVGYVSPSTDGNGVAEILARAIAWNLGRTSSWKSE